MAIALGWNDGIEFEKLPLNFTIKDTWLNETIDSGRRPFNIVTKIDGEKFSKYWLEKVTS